MIKSNCHTHTILCDGKNSAEEMVEAAIKKGFVSLGFSGHSPMYFENDWAMTEEGLKKYSEEIAKLKEKYKEKIEIYCGLELDADFSCSDISNFDYIIASVHQLHCGEKIISIDYTQKELSDCVNNDFGGDWYLMSEQYYSSVCEFVLKIKPDVVGHYDLIEKFNENSVCFDSESKIYQSIALKYLDKICEENPDVIFEVNTGAMYRCGKKLPYPSAFIMKRLKENNMKITITGDSHDVSSLDFAFEEMTGYCKSFGYTEAYILKIGKFVPVSI